jgi:hypothetical protein
VSVLKILLDTADVNYIQMLHDLYPIDGVTNKQTASDRDAACS